MPLSINLQNLKALSLHLHELIYKPGPYEIKYGLRQAVFCKPGNLEKFYTAGAEFVNYAPVPLSCFSVLTAGAFSDFEQLHFVDSDFDRMSHVSKGHLYLNVYRYVERVFGLHYMDPEFMMMDHFDWNRLYHLNPRAQLDKVIYTIENHGLITEAQVMTLQNNRERYAAEVEGL